MANRFSIFFRDNFTPKGRKEKFLNAVAEAGISNRLDYIVKNLGETKLTERYGFAGGRIHNPNEIYQPRDRLQFATRDKMVIDNSILRSVIDKKNKEINRNRTSVKKMFSRKCMREFVPECKNPIHDFQRDENKAITGCDYCPKPDLPGGQEECGETFDTDVIRCTECGFPTRPPDIKQKRKLNKLQANRVNHLNDTFHAVMEGIGLDTEKHDNGFMLSNYEYVFAPEPETGKTPINPTSKIWIQSYRGNPGRIRPIISMEGNLGSRFFTCIRHRKVFNRIELKDFYDNHNSDEDYPRCDEKIDETDFVCNAPLQKVEYVQLQFETDTRKPLWTFIKGEVQHVKKYSPTTAMGLSLIDSLYYIILQLNGQEKWLAEYYLKQRMFKGFLDIPQMAGRKHKNVQQEITAELIKWRQDPWYVPILSSPGTSSRGIKFNRIDDSPKELQYIENREEGRKQIANTYGVTPVFMSDTSTGAGLNNQGMDFIVTNRDVAHGQAVMDEQLLIPYCASFLDIEINELEYFIGYNIGEEQDLMAELQRTATHLGNMKASQELGAEIYINGVGEFESRAPVEGMALVPGSQGITGQPSKDFENVDGMNESGQPEERRSQSKPMQGAPNEPRAQGSEITVKGNGDNIQKVSPILICSPHKNDVFGIHAVNTLSKEVEPYNIRTLYDYMDDWVLSKSIVAKIENEIVGYVIMSQEDLYKQHLMQIAVAPKFRKQGIAKQMMENVILNAKANGVESIKLEVRKSNKCAINLYKLTGFKEKQVLKKFYKNEDGIEMVLVISKRLAIGKSAYKIPIYEFSQVIELGQQESEIIKGEQRSFDEEKHDRDASGVFVPKGQTGAPGKGKASKDDANYTKSSPKKTESCGNCKFFISKDGPDACSKVKGTIVSTAWSRFWKGK